MARYHYDVSGLTDRGNVRTQNQDSLLIKKGRYGGDDFLLLAVADGMGGMERGELASGEMMRILDEWWRGSLKGLWKDGFLWKEADKGLTFVIEEGNRRICSMAADEGIRSGTTLSLLFFYRDRYLLKHVGDSRIYRIGKKQAVQISEDHTWCQQEIKKGFLTKKEAEMHNLRHVLVNALGAGQTVRIDTVLDRVHSGDCFLICSDGFYQYLSEAELVQLMGGWGTAKAKLSLAFQRVKESEADDNLTAILIQRKGWLSKL